MEYTDKGIGPGETPRLSNSFSNTFEPTTGITWSNARTDDFLFTWLLASNDQSTEDWELLFTAWLGEQSQFWCPPGCSGFDILDIPWNYSGLVAQSNFLARTAVAAKALLAQHPGGVYASGFVDDGERSRAGRLPRYPEESVRTLEPALHRAFEALYGWFERLPLDELARRIEKRPVAFVATWRSEPFPASAALLRRCGLHRVVYAPRAEDKGCAMCEEHAMQEFWRKRMKDKA